MPLSSGVDCNFHLRSLFYQAGSFLCSLLVSLLKSHELLVVAFEI